MMTDHTLKKLVLVLLIVGALSAGVWGLFSQRTAEVKTESQDQTRLEQGIYIADSRLVGRLAGKRQWEIASASVRDDGDNVDLENISEVIIFQDNEPYFHVETQRGRWHRPSNNLELMGEILATGPDDFALQTTRLLWEAGDEVLRAPEPVIVNYQGAEIYADTMVAQTAVELVTLTGNVKIIQDGFVWQMQELVYELDKELMHVYGSVTLEMHKEDGE